MTIPVIDIFAGPGGLNEGFSSFLNRQGSNGFSVIASFEMDKAACRTLRLRSTFRRLRQTGEERAYYRMVENPSKGYNLDGSRALEAAWAAAESEVHQIELGKETRSRSDDLISEALSRANASDGTWVLVGGPPCQAYSLAGRSRRTRDETFEDDKKHFLYREYLNILARFRPPVFVMENVKGLLSSTNAGIGMFESIRKDLARPTSNLQYSIYSLVVDDHPEKLLPADFIIRAEQFGVPQRRHRLILLGIRNDIGVSSFSRLTPRGALSVHDAIGGLPKLRSRVSKGPDGLDEWLTIRAGAQSQFGTKQGKDFERAPSSVGGAWVNQSPGSIPNSGLHAWLIDERVRGVAQHETRSHMHDDLRRYWFAAHFADTHGKSPKLADFPAALLPKHANATAENVPFSDRFRVQLWTAPSTTIVSHISKDGHYYIHPDAQQMRSITLREAARLQTFPDNYIFMGNRTEQFVQVGNAVPPLLAHQIAGVVAEILGA